MSRSTLFADIVRALRIARFCEDNDLTTTDGIARMRDIEERQAARRRSRRRCRELFG